MINGKYCCENPWNSHSVDSQGKPTTYLSFIILKTMFCEHDQWFTTGELAELLVAKHTDVDVICRELNMVDLLSENPDKPGHYKYNMNTENTDLQVDFEKYLVDVELGSIPVHLMLDYSPSYRSPCHLLFRGVRKNRY